MEEARLFALAEKFLDDNYSLELDIPIIINSNLESELARFAYTKDGALQIELSSILMKYGTEFVITDTLFHELVHYALFRLGKPFKEGCSYFEDELNRLGVGATEEMFVGRVMEYKCPACRRLFETQLSEVINNPDNYFSECCRTKIKPIRIVICNGEAEIEEWVAN